MNLSLSTQFQGFTDPEGNIISDIANNRDSGISGRGASVLLTWSSSSNYIYKAVDGDNTKIVTTPFTKVNYIYNLTRVRVDSYDRNDKLHSDYPTITIIDDKFNMASQVDNYGLFYNARYKYTISTKKYSINERLCCVSPRTINN